MKHDKGSAVIFLWPKLYATEAIDGTSMPLAKLRNHITSDIASYWRRYFETIQCFPNNSTGKTRWVGQLCGFSSRFTCSSFEWSSHVENFDIASDIRIISNMDLKKLWRQLPVRSFKQVQPRAQFNLTIILKSAVPIIIQDTVASRAAISFNKISYTTIVPVFTISA